ncbi:hypothetical protein IHE30_09865 [Mycetohabitans sp. B46]
MPTSLMQDEVAPCRSSARAQWYACPPETPRSNLRVVLFPTHFGTPDLTNKSIDFFVGNTLNETLRVLYEQLRRALRFTPDKKDLPEGVLRARRDGGHDPGSHYDRSQLSDRRQRVAYAQRATGQRDLVRPRAA